MRTRIKEKQLQKRRKGNVKIQIGKENVEQTQERTGQKERQSGHERGGSRQDTVSAANGSYPKLVRAQANACILFSDSKYLSFIFFFNNVFCT